MDITEVARRTRELVRGVESGVGNGLDRAEGKLAEAASRSHANIDAAFARAQEATAKLADLSAVPLVLGIARKELPKAAEALHQEYKNGGVQQVAADARHVMHEVNVGAGQVVKPIVAQLLTPARENGKATAAALRGDWNAAAEHQVTAVVADVRTLMPAQVAALETGLAAREQGKGAAGVVAAASKAGNRVGLDVANGMNPLYLFPVAGEDGHQAVSKLLLDRDLQGFGRESMTALLHGVQATTSAMGLADAAMVPGRLGLGGAEADFQHLGGRNALRVGQVGTRDQRPAQRHGKHDSQRAADRANRHRDPVGKTLPPAHHDEPGQHEDDCRQRAGGGGNRLDDVVFENVGIPDEAQERH